MSAGCNEMQSLWLRVLGYCLKSVFLIAIITPLQVSCADTSHSKVTVEGFRISC